VSVRKKESRKRKKKKPVRKKMVRATCAKDFSGNRMEDERAKIEEGAIELRK